MSDQILIDGEFRTFADLLKQLNPIMRKIQVSQSVQVQIASIFTEALSTWCVLTHNSIVRKKKIDDNNVIFTLQKNSSDHEETMGHVKEKDQAISATMAKFSNCA